MIIREASVVLHHLKDFMSIAISRFSKVIQFFFIRDLATAQ